GRIAGIRIYVHFTFFILLAFLGLAEGISSGRWDLAAVRLLLFVCLAVIIVLDELGHALAARYYGIRARDIPLLPVGGVAGLARMHEKPLQELVVAIAGPAVNVVLAGLCLVGIILSGAIIGWESLLSFEGNILIQLFLTNVILVLFNMLPAFPMDGGRVLRALLALRMDYVRATRIAAYVGQGMAILFAIAGLTGYASPMLVLIALFVWSGAQAEVQMVRARSLISGVPVARLMTTQLYVLRPNDAIGRAGEIATAGL